jgi:AcrR family transcriptional regulator
VIDVTTEEVRVGDRRPGGRSARVRRAVLDATIELLAKRPYDALTFEEVALRAGVNKTTVYRRWPTKADLVAEATRARTTAVVPVPDSGSLAGDLRALARAVATNIGSPTGGQMSRTMIAAAATSRDVEEESLKFWAERFTLMKIVIDRAIQRGELAARVDGQLVLETLVGPLFVRLLLTGGPIDIDVADAVTTIVSAGIARSTPLGGRSTAQGGTRRHSDPVRT